MRWNSLGFSVLYATLVAAQLFLRSGWRRACVTAAIIPIVIFKNGVRIVAISLLAVTLTVVISAVVFTDTGESHSGYWLSQF